MSFTDSGAEPVQPQGQGEDAGTTDAPYAEYLNRIPEEARGQAEEAFKAWDANTTQRFQEASQYRKSWEPYEQVGVNQHDPQTVQWALQFAQVAQENPQAIQEWFQGYAQQHGLQAAQEAAQEAVTAGEFDPYDPNTLQSQIEKALAPISQQLEQMTQWRSQQEQQAHEAGLERQLEAACEELARKHGDAFDAERVRSLAWKYAAPGADPKHVIQQAWDEFQQWRGHFEKQFVQPKVNVPAPAESGGGIAPAADTDWGMKASNARARAMLEQMRREGA